MKSSTWGPTGSLRVRHIGTDREITLPADYVTSEVTLGYATTIDGAQGLTAGHSCHVVGAEHLTRQLLYVALTRGRVENHVYLSTAEDDPHRILSPKATHPDTAVDVLSKILARDGAQVSATTAEREAADPLLRIAAAADMYHDALGTAAENHLGATRLDKLATLADTLYPRLTHAEGWPVLRNHLALLACAGHNPAAALSEAVAKGGLDDAGDPAAVLDWRIDPTGGHSAGVGPLRWLPAVPDRLGQNPQWGQYLHRRADLVTELADQIRATARAWTPATAPAWAKPLIGTAPELAAEIAVFRAAHRVAPEDSRLVGARTVRGTAAHHRPAPARRRGGRDRSPTPRGRTIPSTHRLHRPPHPQRQLLATAGRASRPSRTQPPRPGPPGGGCRVRASAA